MKKGLGKGLGALFGDDIVEEEKIDKKNIKAKETKEKIDDVNEKVYELKISDIEPNPDQPRKNFDTKKIEELSESIKIHGVIQPILVKKSKYGYEIIAGERRWRAAKSAGLRKIPAIVKEYDEKKVSEVALIENIQRENLNPIEQAIAFKEIIEQYSLTQEELAKSVGKNRTTITNLMRLLNLPEKIQSMVVKGVLSEAQARCLLTIKDEEKQEILANHIIEKGLTVKQVEDIVYKSSLIKEEKNKSLKNNKKHEVFSTIENKLNEYFMTKVKVDAKNNKGKIVIEYYTNDDLERILQKLKINI